jgi:tetratricopeptide (TPR) repeat protein
MSLEDYVNRALAASDDEFGKADIQALIASHLISGMRLQQQGLLEEAIAEYANENNRIIKTEIDAEIVQKSYWHIGMACRKLGQLENAISAFQKARELLKVHGVGASPHFDLAEIFVEMGRFDDAIEVCKELLEKIPDKGVKNILDKAVALKKKSK